jgi:SAM-dependent methyltransferase
MDLARTDLREPKTIQQEHHGKFDLVFCCEVLEHLLVNPVNLLRFLLQFLKPSGFLYLTTPNFLSDINLEKLSLWENPQPVYPQGYSPDEAFHHHVREYAMPELLRFVIEAGGVVDSFAFSGCWQPPEEVARSWPEQLRNMITVIRRP